MAPPNIAASLTALNTLKASLDKVGNASRTVRVTATVNADLARLRALAALAGNIGNLRDKRITVGVAVAGTNVAEIIRLARAVAQLRDKTVTITVNAQGNGLGALGAGAGAGRPPGAPPLPPVPPGGRPGPLPPGAGGGAGYGQGMQNAGYSNAASGSFLTNTLVRPLMGAGGQILTWGSEFEQTMQKVIGLTSVGREELEMLRRGVLSLSADANIRQGPTQLADALYYVSSTGLKGADALQVLRASALGASAGLGEAKVVANTVTSVLDAYGLAADKAGRVTDTLTEAVRYGKGEADKYAAAFPKVIALASQAGVSFEEVAAQMASATRVGLTPSETGTALRQIFSNLIDPSEKAVRTFKQLGTSAQEVRAKLRETGLLNTFKDISARSGGQVEPLAQLFGNIRALTGFLSTTGTATLGEYKKTLAGIESAHGSAYTAAGIASETFAFQLDKLKTSAEKAGIEMSERLLPTLTKVAKMAGRDLPSYLDGAQRTWQSFGEGPQTALKYLGALLLLSGPLKTFLGTLQILGSTFAPLLGLFAAIRTGAPVLALLGRATIPTAILTTGILLWKKYADSVEEARVQQEALRGNTANLDRAFARALGAVEDPRAQKAMKSLSAAIQGAGNDADKLKAALKKATEMKAEIPGLHLAPTAQLVLLTETERAISYVQSRLRALNVRVEVAPVAHTPAQVRQQVQPWESRARAVGVAFPTEPDLANLPATLPILERAKRHREMREQYLRDVEETKKKIIAAERRLNRDLQQEDARLATLSAAAVGQSNAPVDRVPRALEKKGKDLKALTAILQEYNAEVAKGKYRDAANVDAIGQLRTRVNELRGKAKEALDKASTAKAGRDADAALKAQQQAEAEADRVRQAEMKVLGERAQMWQAFGGLVEGVLGRITQLSEQGSVLNEKTAKSRMEAQLLKSVYDGIPSPLKQAAVELAGIEVTMGRIVGQRDGFRALFNDMAQGMTSAQLKSFAPRVDQFGQSLKLGNQMSAAQERARVLGTDLSGTADANRRGLQQEQERLSFAGRKQAGVYDPLYPSEGGMGGVDNRTFDAALTQAIIKGVNTPMGAMACARFVNKAFGILGIEGIKKTESAAQQERNALAAGARRIPVSQAGAGDLLVGPGGGPSGRHVGIGVGNGMFAAKNQDRHSSIAGYNFDAAYDTSALAKSGPPQAPRGGGAGSAVGGAITEWTRAVETRLWAQARKQFKGNEEAAMEWVQTRYMEYWKRGQSGQGKGTIEPAPGHAPGTQTGTRIANVPAAPAPAASNINLPAFEKLDTSLLTRRGMPAGWGSMMNDHAFNARPGESMRFRQAAEEMLLAEMQKGTQFSGQQLQGARQLANQADLNQSTNEAKAATKQRIQALARDMRLLGKTDNPYLVLLDEIQQGLHNYDKAGAQRELGMRFQQMQVGGDKALEGARRRVLEQRSVSQAGNKYLRGDSPDFFAAQQAREARQAELAAWNDPKTIEKFQMESKGKVPRGSANAYAKQLQVIARAERDQVRGDKRGDYTAKATAQYNSELQVLVAQRDRLATRGGAPEEAITRALKSLSDYQAEYTRLVDEHGPVVAATMAREYQARQRNLDIQRESIDLERKELAAIQEREAATRAAARATSDVQAQNNYLSSLDTSSPSAKKDFELFKYWQELEASAEGFDAGKYTQKAAALDAQFQQEAIASYTERLNSLAQSMAQLGDDTGMAALEIELMRGALAGLDKDQKQSIRTGEQSLVLARKRLETGDRVADSEKQGELARAQTARQRLEIEWKYQDAARARREAESGVRQNPDMTGMEAEARGAEGRAADRQDAFEKMREAGDTLRDTISGALHEGFENGVGSGISSMLKRLAEMGIEASVQKMATKWTRGILGDDSVGDAKPGLFDVLKGGGKGAPPLDILGQIGGIAGGNLGDGLAGAAAGMVGSTPAASQTLTLMPQLVNVQAQSANITIGSANISVGASVGAGKMAGAPGSKPSREQAATQILGGLFGGLR